MTLQTTIETQIISHSRKSFAEVIAKELVERCVLTES